MEFCFLAYVHHTDMHKKIKAMFFSINRLGKEKNPVKIIIIQIVFFDASALRLNSLEFLKKTSYFSKKLNMKSSIL